MRLLVDSDIFCKLGVSGLLSPALAALGVSHQECGRLPALPHMLHKGKLPRLYGEAACRALVESAHSMPVAPAAGDEWLDQLVGVNEIDIGEAQLYAIAAERGLTIATGDKRALRAVAKLPRLHPPLAGRVVTFEAILLELYTTMGASELRQAVSPLSSDGLIKVCFSPGNDEPSAALHSSLNALAAEVAPLALWQPGTRIGP
jgi:hypothetical protein